MKRIVFHLDPVSPFVHLAFMRLPEALAGCSVEVEIRPVLFAGLLKALGHKGPAEIEPKRQWTFRHVAWMAQQHGIRLDVPAAHPFNPLPLLRLLLAAGANRHHTELVLRHVWEGGLDATDPQRLAALRQALAPDGLPRDPDGDDVKAELRAHTDAALAAGVFGVPSFELGGRVFWGLDALPMLRDAVQGGTWFDGPAWDAAGAPRPGVRRA
ncbi:MAG: 2-hydroxychromene-2-carboxylate isomerase [Betaproteobacteria bacterium]|jgi:2-hydroxychromene-2-carboxylate isomerase